MNEQVVSMTRRMEYLGSHVQSLTKCKRKEESPHADVCNFFLSQSNCIDPQKVTTLAITLTEGAIPAEIAGQLLDEVDRAAAGEPIEIEEVVPAIRDGTLKGIVEANMARIAALEAEVGEIKRLGMYMV